MKAAGPEGTKGFEPFAFGRGNAYIIRNNLSPVGERP